MFSCQKHFSKNKLVQNDKKINNITDTKKSKRASFSASKFFMLKLFRSEEGAMTLEATLIVPIFLIVLIMLASAGEIFMIHQQIAHGVCEAAKRAAVNEYQIRQKRNTGGNLTVLSAKETFLTSVNRRFLDRSALIGGSAVAAAS
jgi:Flp pilus assembly protein TadG